MAIRIRGKMRLFTKIQQKILIDLFLNNGEVRSLSQMADRLDIDYGGARENINALERQGIVKTERHYSGMIVRLCSGAEIPIAALLWGKQPDSVHTNNDKRASTNE